MEIRSVFIATDLETGKRQRVEMTGAGQGTVHYMRRQFHPLTKFVLEGFKINGKFKEVDLYSRY